MGLPEKRLRTTAVSQRTRRGSGVPTHFELLKGGAGKEKGSSGESSKLSGTQ